VNAEVEEVDSAARLVELVETGDEAAVRDLLDGLGPRDTVHALFRLSDTQQEWVLTLLEPEDAAELVGEIPEVHAVDLLEGLPASQAASILQEMDSAERADLIGEMDEAEAEAILAEMSPDDAASTRALTEYEDETAGGLMITEYLSFPETGTVGDAVRRLRAVKRDEIDFEAHVYVYSATARLVGVLDLRDLVLAPHREALVGLARSPLYVSVDTTLDALNDFFDEYDFEGVPVVDAHHRLVGVVRSADVADALAERSDSDYLKTQGIVGGEEIRSMPTLLRSRRRLVWLSLNIVLNVMAASVIAAFEETLSAVIALAVFLPIVSDMSGCTGNQAVAVSMRELSLGIVKPHEAMRVWLKELSVALINGLVLGTLLAGAAWLWKGNPWLGLVVGVALAANTMIAASIGGTVPLLLRRFGLDPAVGSGPILTTVTDMCGFFLVLGLASQMLPLLVTG